MSVPADFRKNGWNFGLEQEQVNALRGIAQIHGWPREDFGPVSVMVHGVEYTLRVETTEEWHIYHLGWQVNGKPQAGSIQFHR